MINISVGNGAAACKYKNRKRESTSDRQKMFKTIKNKIEKVGKGHRYPLSKYERNLETILSHQQQKMITTYDYVPVDENKFFKHLQESTQAFRRCTKTIRRRHRHAAFNLL